MFKTLVKFGLLCGILLIFLTATSALATSDPFGALDVIYLDTVEASAGEQVTLAVKLRNDEALSSVSVPLTYNPDFLTLTALSFSGSRAEYLATKLMSPDKTANINGHFLVGLVVVFEDPLPAGDGTLFTCTFTVADSADIGQSFTIDSLFYPPGGELILAEAATSTIIEPAFGRGLITIGQPNRAPSFVGLSDQTILEGDSLVLDVLISDPDNDQLSLAVTSKPLGATFSDNGDGTGRFVWRPGFVGPFSADGSPFSVGFWAGDGNLSVEESIDVTVVNINRRPQIAAPSEMIVDAGAATTFEVVATDPDFEAITWQIQDAHSTAVVTTGNPASYTWQSQVTDTEDRGVTFIARDPNGAADTAVVLVRVRPATLYSVAIDSVTGDLGTEIEVGIAVENLVPIGGFDFVFSYDQSGMTLINATNAGTRSQGFEYFSMTPAYGGVSNHIRVVGLASQTNPGSAELAAGSGRVATIRFRLAGDLSYAGLSVPIPFVDLNGGTSNLLLDSLGSAIAPADVFFINGRLQFNSFGEIKVGDINLNGIAFEIGDVIRFTNYFINPRVYGFSLLQFANSDINRDDFVATVADLVALINVVVKGTPPPVARSGGFVPEAVVKNQRDRDTFTVSYDANFDVAAVLAKFTVGESFDPAALAFADDRMDVLTYRNGSTFNVLIYSLDGTTLPAGNQQLLTVETGEEIALNEIAMASPEGDLASVELLAAATTLPEGYVLYQNYPNPFNPETQIAFDLPAAGAVRLDIFNVLGQQVLSLYDGVLPAGTHTLTWNGRDRSGQSVSSGVYLYRLATDQTVLTRKMMLLK